MRFLIRSVSLPNQRDYSGHAQATYQVPIHATNKAGKELLSETQTGLERQDLALESIQKR